MTFIQTAHADVKNGAKAFEQAQKDYNQLRTKLRSHCRTALPAMNGFAKRSTLIDGYQQPYANLKAEADFLLWRIIDDLTAKDLEAKLTDLNKRLNALYAEWKDPAAFQPVVKKTVAKKTVAGKTTKKTTTKKTTTKKVNDGETLRLQREAREAAGREAREEWKPPVDTDDDVAEVVQALITVSASSDEVIAAAAE